MRILIADDQPKVRFALRVVLEQRPGSKQVGEAVDAASLLAQARAICPDLVILDWDLPGMPAPDLQIQLRKVCPDLLVIALSGNQEAQRAALGAGADAFVCKCDSPDQLLSAIEASWRKWQASSEKNLEVRS